MRNFLHPTKAQTEAEPNKSYVIKCEFTVGFNLSLCYAVIDNVDDARDLANKWRDMGLDTTGARRDRAYFVIPDAHQPDIFTTGVMKEEREIGS